MKQRDAVTPFYAARAYRIASGAFGMFLVGIGLHGLHDLFAVGPMDLLRLAGIAAVVAVGGNLVRSACAGTESWLSKIGPLP